MSERKRIAAIITTYFPLSHADVMVGKFVNGFPTDEGVLAPKVDIASMYIDQLHEEDIGVALGKEHDIPVYPSIVKALTLGGEELAVDGVLCIGEHGDYALNEKGQKIHPRRYFFEQICAVFAAAGRSVPVFNDKHLSHSWEDAKWMYERAKELDVPFMAGSSIPTLCRDPWLEHDVGAPVDEAVMVSYGPIEAYGYHALEALQAMVERRREGETGIRAVHCIEGQDVWRAVREEPWLGELTRAACDATDTKESGRMEDLCKEPTAFLLEYVDGLRGGVVILNGYLTGWSYAARVAGRVDASMLRVAEAKPHPHFSYLSLNVQEMFLTGKPQYPVERTLLVTGALDALMDSRYRGHARTETPHLDVHYSPPAHPPIRPSGPRPVGASIQSD